MEKKHLLIAGVVSLFGLSLLMTLVSFFVGIWWKLTYDSYILMFTLWKINSKFINANEITMTLSDSKLESVIVTTRTCLVLSFIFYALLIVTYVVSFRLKQKQLSNHRWLRARTVFFILLLLSFGIAIAHAAHCPPAYLVGQNAMSTSLSSGWNLCLAALIFISVPANFHFFKEFQLWRSENRKT